MARILDSVPVYRQERFTFNARTQTFVAFASDFNGSRGYFARLYDDACDAGFGIESKATGKVVYFSFVREEKDGDDVIANHFEAVVDPNSALHGLKVTIFNT